MITVDKISIMSAIEVDEEHFMDSLDNDDFMKLMELGIREIASDEDEDMLCGMVNILHKFAFSPTCALKLIYVIALSSCRIARNVSDNSDEFKMLKQIIDLMNMPKDEKPTTIEMLALQKIKTIISDIRM